MAFGLGVVLLFKFIITVSFINVLLIYLMNQQQYNNNVRRKKKLLADIINLCGVDNLNILLIRLVIKTKLCNRSYMQWPVGVLVYIHEV